MIFPSMKYGWLNFDVLFCVLLQLYAGQNVLRAEYAVPARSFAKGAGSAPSSLKGDGEFLIVFFTLSRTIADDDDKNLLVLGR